MLPKRVQNVGLSNNNNCNNSNNLKTSIYDWDSPSSYTGTVKRRPPSSCQETTDNPPSNNVSLNVQDHQDNRKQQLFSEKQKQEHYSHSHNNKHQGKEIEPNKEKIAQGNISENKNLTIINTKKISNNNQSKITKPLKSCNQNDSSLSSSSLRKRGKYDTKLLCTPKINSTLPNKMSNNRSHVKESKSSLKPIKKNLNEEHNQKASSIQHAINSVSNRHLNVKNVKFTELFCDFPHCTSDSNSTVENCSMSTKPLPPPYQPPPQPPPLPPLNEIPSFKQQHSREGGGTLVNEKLSGKQYQKSSDVLKQQCKGLIKTAQGQLLLKGSHHQSSAAAAPHHGASNLSGISKDDIHQKEYAFEKFTEITSTATSTILTTNSSTTSTISAAAGSTPPPLNTPKQRSPYKGCVSDLKNCISKINTKGIFSLSGTMKSYSDTTSSNSNEGNKTENQHVQSTSSSNSNEYILYNPIRKTSTKSPSTMDKFISESNSIEAEDDILTKPEFTSSLFKNIPVRPRKGGIPHMDNYCLFDPSVDFINEKDIKKSDPTTVAAAVHSIVPPHFLKKTNSLEKTVLVQNSIEIENCFEDNFHFDNISCTGEHGDDEELVQEVIYEDNPRRIEEQENNYFTIDPDDFVSDCNNDDDDDAHGRNAKTLTSEIAILSNPFENCDEEDLRLPLMMSNDDEFEKNSSESTGSPFIIIPDTSALVRRKTLLSLSPFNTSSLRSNRSVSLTKETDLRFRNRTMPLESTFIFCESNSIPPRSSKRCKLKKSRPLSTLSDADSGFLSPCSPEELKFNPTIMVLEQCESIQGYIEIYTDWANYYLDRAKSKKKVSDLSADCRDGLLLADIIEAVTSFKVPDLVKKPKSQQQMFDNVNSCLSVLRAHSVGGLDTITTNDICAGRLKAVLALFFALSRYKQQTKQQQKSSLGLLKTETQPSLPPQHSQQQLQAVQAKQPSDGPQHQQQQSSVSGQSTQIQSQSNNTGNSTMTSVKQIPVPYSKTNGATAIPLPATVLVQRRCPPDKVRPLPPTPNHTPAIPGLGKPGGDISSSRPGSPPTNNYPQSQKSYNNGFRQSQCKIPTSPHHSAQQTSGGQSHTVPSEIQQQNNSSVSGISGATATSSGTISTNTGTTPAIKHSMLDKFRLFNKEKSSSNQSSSTKSQVSKRTSSSSGFSSARSERSDSSLSLNESHASQIKPPSIIASTAIKTKDQCAKNTKQSKLLSASQKTNLKDVNSTKSISKKEKSPGKKESDVQVGDSKLVQLSINHHQQQKNQKTTSISNNNLKADAKVSKMSSKLSSSRSDMKSESKLSLISNNASKTTLLTNTGIPKPMAAIKGTTKPTPEKKQLQFELNESNKQQKNEKHSDISLNRRESTTSVVQQDQNYTAHKKSSSYQSNTTLSSSPAHINNSSSNENNSLSTESNCMITNGPINKLLQNNAANSSSNPSISMSDSLHSNSTHSGGGLHSNSSESSVIYRPSPDSGSDIHYVVDSSKMHPSRNISSNKKLDFIRGGGGGDRLMREENHMRMNGITETSNATAMGGQKFHTIPTKIVGTIYEEEKPVDIMPMRPLLRGYNSHVTLPTRGTRGQHYVSDFCETDIGHGYCSDGDALRRGPSSSRYNDIDNGYVSEGSTGTHGTHGKHFLSMMRARSHLPTTIEERIRGSKNSLENIGTASLGFGSKMDMNNGSPNNASNSKHPNFGRGDWGKMPEPINGHGQSMNSCMNRKIMDNSPNRRSGTPTNHHASPKQQQQQPSSSAIPSTVVLSVGKTKGVPQSFGYVKRSNNSATGTITTTDQQHHHHQNNVLLLSQQHQFQQQHQQQHAQVLQQQQNVNCTGGRTAHVSAVPRTSGKVKVSGGTQTCTSDLQTKMPSNSQHRSFSLTGPGATQLSQSIRERLCTGSHSLPKPGTDMHIFQHRISSRGKILDGSLSDTQTYAEVKPEYSTYAMWLKHSNTASSRLSEGDSIENLQGGSPGMTRHGHKLLHRGESSYIQSPRLNRSNSIRSTKSEKMYPSMLTRGGEIETEPYYCLPVGTITHGANGNPVNIPWSQPTSPTPPNRGFGGPLSPTHAGGGTCITASHRLTYPKKNDDVHGSAASLLSGGSSLYGSAEERQATEVRRLKRELTDARDQVMSLSSQLSTNVSKILREH